MQPTNVSNSSATGAALLANQITACHDVEGAFPFGATLGLGTECPDLAYWQLLVDFNFHHVGGRKEPTACSSQLQDI
eukprot:3645546-Prymnesium_polylepis.1